MNLIDDLHVSDTYVIGDLNYNMLNEYNSYKLTEFNAIHGLVNTIFKPTRLSAETGNSTLLDVIQCDSYSSFVSSDVFSYPNSDHRLVISTFNHRSSSNKKVMINLNIY